LLDVSYKDRYHHLVDHLPLVDLEVGLLLPMLLGVDLEVDLLLVVGLGVDLLLHLVDLEVGLEDLGVDLLLDLPPVVVVVVVRHPEL